MLKYIDATLHFAFVNPMPNEEKLNEFYEKVYRSEGRPPYLISPNYEDQKKHYLEDKNLSYILYLTTFVNMRKIKTLYDFGGGDGDLGYALKKNFLKSSYIVLKMIVTVKKF